MTLQRNVYWRKSQCVFVFIPTDYDLNVRGGMDFINFV